jgi:outer membrane protein assembly factor BamE (lipoprotein component of BamABCDE complex)
MNKNPMAWAVVTCVVLSAGCSFNRGTLGDEFKNENVAAVKKGTTRANVISSLGAPDRIVEANGHEILQYYRYDIKASGLFLIVVNFSRINVKSDDLYVFVNKDGVVDEVIFGRRTDNMDFRFWPFGE